jgi:DNA ligase-1
VTTTVCVFVFDLLFHDGETLLGLALRERRARLLAALPAMRPGYVQLATSVEIDPQQSQPAAAAAAAAESAGAGSSDPQLPGAAAEEAAGAAQQQARQVQVQDAQGAAAVAGSPGSRSAPQVQAGDAAAALEQRLFDLLLAAFDTGAEGLMLKRLDHAAGGRPGACCLPPLLAG